MATRESLEAALQTAWDPDVLEVYGDELLSAGDPRGELIALDRRPVAADPTWGERRRAALVRWLGDEVAPRAGHLVQHGFIHELRCGSHAPELLDGELGGLVRGYTVWGDHPRVGATLARLASRPRPWLKRLAIAYWGTRPYPQQLAAELISATPNLEELHLVGRPAFTELVHPRVRRVVLDQTMAIAIGGVERERRTSVEGSTGWPVRPEDVELVVQITRDLDDCNLLYDWYAGAFDEPAPALLARVAAAGLVELDGPIVRPRRSPALPDPMIEVYAEFPLFADTSVAPALALGTLRGHAEHVLDALQRFAPPAAQHHALAEYLTTLESLGSIWPPANPAHRTLRSLVPALAIALDGLLERRALVDEPRGERWPMVEQLAGLLALPGAHKRLVLRVG